VHWNNSLLLSIHFCNECILVVLSFSTLVFASSGQISGETSVITGVHFSAQSHRIQLKRHKTTMIYFESQSLFFALSNIILTRIPNERKFNNIIHIFCWLCSNEQKERKTEKTTHPPIHPPSSKQQRASDSLCFYFGLYGERGQQWRPRFARTLGFWLRKKQISRFSLFYRR
jgi:hypothetical protein